MKMRAAVMRTRGQPLTIEHVDIAALGPGDVLVRLRAAGLCHTDLEISQGTLVRPLPIVLGHEGAGIVEGTSKNVTLVKPGDHVVCSWNPNCGHCYYCERNLPILCEPFGAHSSHGHLYNGASYLSVDGEAIHHFMMVSSFAEFCILPEAGAIPVPREIPFDRACLLGCAVMTGFGAAVNIAPVEYGGSALIVGCGAVGLNAIQGSALIGAGAIIGVDTDPRKLQLALELGATDVIDARRDDVQAEVRRLTRGRGADCGYEAAGNEAAMQTVLECVRPGGQVVLLGKFEPDRKVAFRWASLMGEKRIRRSSYGGARPRRDFPRLARAYLDGNLKLDELIDRRIALDEINNGLAAMQRGETIRSVITFEG